MPPLTQEIQAPRIALNTDFGHAPLGKLGDRSAQIGNVTGSHPTPAGESAKNLLSRFANAITPKDVRVESKFRQDLGKFSENMSNVLGKIATGQGKDSVVAGLHKLLDSAAPLVRRGADVSEMTDSQLKLKLSQMSPDELAALHMGLADAKEMGIDPESNEGALLQFMLNGVTQAQLEKGEALNDKVRDKVEKNLKPLVEKLISVAAKETGMAGTLPGEKYVEAFDALQRDALTLAQSMEPHGLPETLDKIKNSLIQEAMLSAMGDDPIPLGKALSYWPGSEISSLSSARPIYSDDIQLSAITSICNGQVGLRAQNFDSSVHRTLDSILSRTGSPEDPRSPLNDPVGFAKDVIALQRDLALSREHHDRHHMKWDSTIDTKYEEALKVLDKLVDGEKLNLTDLSTETFGQLRLALEKMDLKGADPALLKEGEARLETAKKNYQQTLENVFNAITTEDDSALLRHLGELTRDGNIVLQTLESTGGKYEGADDLMQLRSDWLSEFLGQMDAEKLEGLHAKLSQPGMFVLGEVLGSAGAEILSSMERSYPSWMQPKGRELYNVAADLQLIRSSVAESMGKLGMEVPPTTEPSDLSPSKLTSDQKAAIQEVYGLSIEPDGYVRQTSGTMPEGIQEQFKEALTSRSRSETSMQSIGGRPTGVTTAFWLDFNRADYNMDDGEGAPKPFFDRNLSPETTEMRMLYGVDSLKTFCNKDPELLAFITSYTHQSLFAPIEAALMDPQSPLKLPDGTTGQLTGEHSVSYTFSKDDEGNISVKAEYSIPIARAFNGFGPEGVSRVLLDPRTSHARYSTELTFTPDRQVSVSQPLELDYRLDLDTTWKNEDFTRPINLADLMARKDESALQDAFSELCRTRFATENLTFMRSVRDLGPETTLDEVRALTARFIGKQAPEQVNIDGFAEKRILREVAEMTPETFDIEKVRALFQPAYDTVANEVKNGPFGEFIRNNQK